MADTKKNKTETSPPATVQNFPIVGIGASAGGLEAFKLLLTAIPLHSGMAYVLVQHLHPNHESILPEILQRVTKLPVHEITDEIHLAPDHIYIIPSNKILTSTDGILELTPRINKNVNHTIDIFFTTLADVHKEFAVGIVLSGTGTDGTLGLKAIKENGGICIAQDAESAAYNSMPVSALNAGVVDFVLPPEKIPAQLLLINRTYKTSHVFIADELVPKDDEDIFKQILLLLKIRSGVDFTHYKKPTFHRRIARRIALSRKDNLTDYLAFLRVDKGEQDALFHDVLIPVTSFFRDPETFKALNESIFPALFKNKANDEPIRIWIAGCSTGEEAFSVAMCLHQLLGDKFYTRKIQIFASDVSEHAIKKARTGMFSKVEVEKLTTEQIKNYFHKKNGNYEINKQIRDLCIFAPHNFLKDPPFAKIDLISCRNVLIYMNTFLQKKAFNTFHYALKEDGYLLLGKSETVGASSDLFTQVNKHEKLYTRNPLAGRFVHVAIDRKEEMEMEQQKIVIKQDTKQTDFRKSAEAVLISKSPASAVVNAHMEIVHIQGNITPYLETPQGKPTYNLLKMAREGLAFELRNAIHKATKEASSITTENIPVMYNGVQFTVALEIIPLTDTIEPFYLILFHEKAATSIVDEKLGATANIKKSDSHKQNLRLERELSQTREDMRSITEDMEAANEELQSGNEELQSSNEEMQSLNEELETSKEELQSTNEELIIVNQELLDKQEQLNIARTYAESIVSTIREPLIILDKMLRIKSANASFYKKFNCDETDTEGQLFYEIQNNKWDDTVMRSMLEKILPKRERLTDFEITIKSNNAEECTFLLNALQIQNEIKSEQLILLAIEDITEKKALAEKLETTRIELKEKNRLIEVIKNEQTKLASQLKLATDSAKVGVWSLDLITSKIEWSNFHKKMWGYSEHLEDLTYQDWYKVILPEDKELAIKKIEESKVNRAIYEADYRIKRANDGAIVWIKSTGQYQYDEFGVAITLTGISIDITEQKSFTEALEDKVIERTRELQNSYQELKQSNLQLDQFAYVASHDLQEPLRKIITFSLLLQDKHKTGLSAEGLSYLKRIEASSVRMRTLIQDLLNYSRLVNHEKLYIKTDLNEILKNILIDFELLTQEKKARIKFDKLPTIDAMPLQMNQLFYNLIGNALKFTKMDVVPVISIRARLLTVKQIQKHAALNPLNVYYEIIFKDNGIGFEQEYAKKIFTLFQRLHNQEKYMGTGIGLAITKKIVENHKGEIFADGSKIKGASFHIILPVKQPK